MKYAEFAEKIEATYHGKFKKSCCKVEAVKGFGKYIWITCYLAENLNEVAYRIAGNDMFHISFRITLPDNFSFEKDELPENMVLENLAKMYLIKPENNYLCYSSRKLTYRKASGTAEKLIATFGKFVDKLHAQLVEDLENGNIHENHRALAERKI